MRPREGFSPTTPQHEAGTRIDPPPCGPSSSFVASLNPLSVCYNFVLSLPHPLTQIKTRPPRSAMLGNVRAGHGQKPGEEGGRDYPLKLGPGLGLARSGLTLFWNDLDELAGLADPRAPQLRAMKATLAEIGQSRDDWRRQAEVRRLWQWVSRPCCARSWRSEFRPRSARRRPRNPSANDRCLARNCRSRR